MSNGSTTRRDQIRLAAEELFRTRGYLATSMRHIADKMELSGGGSLYAHIHGKEDLLWEIAIDAIDTFIAAQDVVWARDLPPIEKLREAMIAHVSVIMNQLGAAAVYFDEWRHLGDERRQEFAARRDAYEQRFQALIHAGIESDDFAIPDERFATLYVLGALNAIRRWYRPDGRLSPDEVANLMAESVLNGLLKR